MSRPTAITQIAMLKLTGGCLTFAAVNLMAVMMDAAYIFAANTRLEFLHIASDALRIWSRSMQNQIIQIGLSTK